MVLSENRRPTERPLKMIDHSSVGRSAADGATTLALVPRDRLHAYFQTRLMLLSETIPRGTRKRTTRGRMATCAQLGSHRRQAEQLFAHAQCPDDRERVDTLIRRIEEARSQGRKTA